MIIQQISLIFVVGLFNCAGRADPINKADQDKGQISGHIIDSENCGVGGVMIVVCDQATGLPSQEAEILTIKPLGSCSLEINTRPSVPNNSTLLVISHKPMAADPILGFAGWSGSFMQEMVGWNRMLLGKTTVHGLPPGKVYLGAFANDNNPGFGGTSVDIKEAQGNQVTIPLIASWSNGVREPPPELRPLMRKIQQIPGGATETLIGAQHPEIIEKRDKLKNPTRQILEFWTPYLNQTVRVDDQDVLIKDLIAAESYLGLERHAKLLLERRKEQELKKNGKRF